MKKSVSLFSGALVLLLLTSCSIEELQQRALDAKLKEVLQMVEEDVTQAPASELAISGFCDDIRSQKRPDLDNERFILYGKACAGHARSLYLASKPSSSTTRSTSKPSPQASNTGQGTPTQSSQDGESLLRVPSLLGLSERDARQYLQRNGYRLTLFVQSKRADGKIGSAPLTSCLIAGNQPIFQQSPAPGREVRVNSTITAWVDCEDRAAYGD